MANKKTVVIHAYKYDGQIYRCYETPAIISEDENYIVVDLYRTRINTYKAEADNNYFSKITYPCVWYFFKKE
jgi:protein associated with RNAse G/E